MKNRAYCIESDNEPEPEPEETAEIKGDKHCKNKKVGDYCNIESGVESKCVL